MKKAGQNTVAIVSELVAPIADSLGLTVWDVQFEKEGSTWTLRVIIDKEEGISLDDCEALSRPLDALLDEKDPIEQSYCLEVSSAGIERALTKDWHYEHCKGEQVVMKLIRPKNGEREFIGTLIGLENGEVSVQTANGTVAASQSELAYVRLYIEF